MRLKVGLRIQELELMRRDHAFKEKAYQQRDWEFREKQNAENQKMARVREMRETAAVFINLGWQMRLRNFCKGSRRCCCR